MKVLIADDDPMFCLLFESIIKKMGFDIIIANDGDEALKILQSDDAPELAILDWVMPKLDGIDVCKKMRECNNEPYKYIILVTSKDDQKNIIQGMEAGADDYITKPFSKQELSVRINAGKRIINLQKQLIDAREHMRYQATYDKLTGIFNRAAIFEFLSKELSRAKRAKTSLGVVLLDLDHFKKINDTYGHLAGDEVLKTASQLIQSSIRPYDRAGRYGGEEFIIILPDADIDESIIVAERIRKSIEKATIATAEGSIDITVSLGVTAINKEYDNDNLNSIIKTADMALYTAKNSGRNRVEKLEFDSMISYK